MDRENLLMAAAGELGITLDNAVASRFVKYMEITIAWNKRMNLTAITDERDFVLKHFADSLTPLTIPGLFAAGARVIDVGTGAGFPGIPLKLARDDLRLTLLETSRKRADFLQECVKELGLSSTEVVWGRAETEGAKSPHREAYDIATARAVAPLNILAEYCLPFVQNGGKFVSMKGKIKDAEIMEAHGAIKTLGGGQTTCFDINIPFTDFTRAIIVVDKIGSTPPNYPRKPGKPEKSPLL